MGAILHRQLMRRQFGLVSQQPTQGFSLEDPQVRLETWASRADGFLDQHVPLELREPK